jgi:hypothetical protein
LSRYGVGVKQANSLPASARWVDIVGIYFPKCSPFWELQAPCSKKIVATSDWWSDMRGCLVLIKKMGYSGPGKERYLSKFMMKIEGGTYVTRRCPIFVYSSSIWFERRVA